MNSFECEILGIPFPPRFAPAPTLTIDVLVEAKRQVEEAIRLAKPTYARTRKEDAPRVADLGLNLEESETIPPGIAVILSGDREVLGWMNFDQDIAYMFTEEQLRKNRDFSKGIL